MAVVQRPLGDRLGVLFFFVLGIAAFKWSVIGPYRADDFVLGLAVELAFWGWLAWVCEIIALRAPRAARLLFYPVFIFSASLVFSYTFFFDSAVERRFSLLDTDMGGMVFFLRDVLPQRGWVILIALIAFTTAGALLVRTRWRRPHLATMAVALVATTLFAFQQGNAAVRVATPFYDVVHDYLELMNTPKVVVGRATQAFMQPHTLDKSDRVPATLQTPFKKVLVFVMETMTAEKLAKEKPSLKEQTLFVSGRSKSHLYDRYFPNNQDSRTGMLDLLGSRLIPYEAYRDADVEAYQGVAELPSLLDPFKRMGYRTVFAVSQTGLEEVVSELPWDNFIHLHDEEIAEIKKHKLCFEPYEFEHGCEDAALLPKLFDLVDNNDKVFLFQEFIWGHASEYNEASGRLNAEYYSTYVDAVIAHLEEKKLLDETLIAITSDHGFRDKGLQDQVGVYRIPLQFYSSRFQETHNAELLSHLDFKDLLFNEMQAGSTPIDHNEAVLIQGPTATALFAAITNDNDFLLVKSRGSAQLILSNKNVGATLTEVEPARSTTAPSALMKLREEYKAHFDARVTRAKSQ